VIRIFRRGEVGSVGLGRGALFEVGSSREGIEGTLVGNVGEFQLGVGRSNNEGVGVGVGVVKYSK